MADHADGKAPPRHRRLLLLRHAKSAWPEGVPDHERPLAERGEKAAPAMGNHMAREHLIPGLALVSDARRTQETWKLVKSRLPGAVEARVTPALYDASAAQMLEVLRKTDANTDTVLMIGHNPGLQELALMLVGEGHAQARDAMAEKYPTGALAVIDFAIGDWPSVEPGSGFLADFLTPRSLR
ncbi:MAG: histidine phosphatase family protein [Alphaproteobacteria bacterium]|nr:histidine phosphatase family protein [Hyphomicrobiales bacterium]MBU1316104.1 histidine phosphatase family protein [Alphaproteobacteria bacterium]MBU1549852.1 histidine phosphatase family protein [Alphaproteobacteria bacterium]MBU2336692.1 histidine phosphatase family protein [Alphaproteobacteria bacterium]MBU2387425.1 histidine phosphatase family protein [Alphaproteobacteria bacterium]